MFGWVGGWVWVLFAFPACIAFSVVAWREAHGYLLLAAARRNLRRRGVDFIIVYSNSPNWKQHILDTWVPRLGSRAALLNWSERARWQPTLEVRLFNHFVKAPRNFNPAVLALRGLRRPLVYRFYDAFRHAKHDRTDYLETLERELFEHVKD